jgi:hypothetical protein
MKKYNNVAGGYITPQEKSDTIEYKYYKNNIRTHAPRYTQYYDAPQKNIKRCKIVVDSWYQGKTLSMMARQHKAIKETPIYYYIDLETGTIDKLKVYLHHHKNTTLNNNNVFYGTKTQAQKRLEKLMA